MEKYIYHITHPKTWELKKDEKFFLGETLSSVGFIHCCDEEKINFVLKQWFDEQENLLLIKIEVEKLSSSVVYENLEGGESLFPHIYGPINLDAIISVQNINKERKNG